MDTEGLACENTIARNQLMIDGLELGNAEKETLWGGADMPPATKRKSVGEGRKSGRKKAKQRLDPVLRENQSDSGDDSDADESPAPPAKQKTGWKGERTKERGGSEIEGSREREGRKGWAVTAKELLMKKDFGGGWPALVGVWWKREEKVGFKGTVKARPSSEEMTYGGEGLDCKSPQAHTRYSERRGIREGVGVWWLDINPARRGEERPMSRETGEWDCLDLYGPNGFLNVLIALKWWRDAMDEASPDWDEAIADITWVLREMERWCQDQVKQGGQVGGPQLRSPAPQIQCRRRRGGPNTDILIPAQNRSQARDCEDGNEGLSPEELWELQNDPEAAL
ncbi:hypothetical protein B0H14DRAFT_2587086 [Mycena olivaceomarginata]|nr:hypothetical protein B0H14DRAFT_2587086 [Mycena olivaceomarginata]